MILPSSEFVILLSVIIALAVLIAVAYRWTTLRQVDYQGIVQENDTAFKQLANTLKLTFTPGRTSSHPVVGMIPIFGTIQGLYRNLDLTLHVIADENGEPPVVFRTQIIARPPVGMHFETTSIQLNVHRRVIEKSHIIAEPQVTCRAGSMSYKFFVMTDPVALKGFLDEVCSLGESLLR